MSILTNRRTCTAVHTKEAALNQRQGAALQGHFTLSALHLYAQLLCAFAFTLYRHTGTPGYMSVLLAALPLTLFYLLSCRLGKMQGLTDTPWGRCSRAMIALCLLTDAQMSLYAFTEIVREMLPDYNSAVIALISLLCVLPSLRRQNAHALPTLAHLMRWPLAAGMAFCLLGAARQGESGHLFPLLGQDVRRIFTGALFLCSCLSAAVTPLFLHRPPENLQQKRKGLASLLFSLLAAALTAFLSAWLLPHYFLAQPDTVGSLLLIPLRFNPSLPAFSLLVCCMLMLLLISLACALSRSRHLFSLAIGRPVSLFAGLLLVPLPALSTDAARQVLSALAPLRSLLLLAAFLLLLPAAKKKKEAGPA